MGSANVCGDADEEASPLGQPDGPYLRAAILFPPTFPLVSVGPLRFAGNPKFMSDASTCYHLILPVISSVIRCTNAYKASGCYFIVLVLMSLSTRRALPQTELGAY